MARRGTSFSLARPRALSVLYVWHVVISLVPGARMRRSVASARSRSASRGEPAGFEAARGASREVGILFGPPDGRTAGSSPSSAPAEPSASGAAPDADARATKEGAPNEGAPPSPGRDEAVMRAERWRRRRRTSHER